MSLLIGQGDEKVGGGVLMCLMQILNVQMKQYIKKVAAVLLRLSIAVLIVAIYFLF